MDREELRKCLEATTTVLRKGEAVVTRREGYVEITEVFGYPPVSDWPGGDGFPLVDCHFVAVGVTMGATGRWDRRFEELLAAYPRPERLAQGPSYIEFAAELEVDQDVAFRVFALGDALGLWQIITPASLGFAGGAADELAGSGCVMTSGYRKETPT